MTGKERLIELLKLLFTKTDESYPITTVEVITCFESRGIPTDRNTVRADIDTLNRCGIEVYTI